MLPRHKKTASPSRLKSCPSLYLSTDKRRRHGTPWAWEQDVAWGLVLPVSCIIVPAPPAHNTDRDKAELIGADKRLAGLNSGDSNVETFRVLTMVELKC